MSLEPYTRKEKLYSNILGSDYPIEPFTREEEYLDEIAKNLSDKDIEIVLNSLIEARDDFISKNFGKIIYISGRVIVSENIPIDTAIMEQLPLEIGGRPICTLYKYNSDTIYSNRMVNGTVYANQEINQGEYLLSFIYMMK